MSKQIERIFICLLWLLAATLGACFWLNTFFGFNIFSGPHWQYLAYLQASQTPVRNGFYISIVILALITVTGLYILMRPGAALRRLRHSRKVANIPVTNIAQESPQVQPQTTVPQLQLATTPIQNQSTRPRAPIGALRTTQAPTMQTSAIASAPPVQSATASIDFTDIKDIFTDAGYLVKRSPQIGNFKPALLAIGTDEQLWIGAVGIGQQPIITATERMAGIFADTLDDIEININAFVVAPSETISAPEILTFDTINQLREYMQNNKNTPPTETNGDQENFDAYSEYIDTVITYMDKT